MEDFKLNSIEDALKDFQEGKFVIVVDDEDRENEGDLIMAAEKITPEKVNFMLKNARGVLCVPITMSRADELDLPHQVSDNTSMLGTPFTVTEINWKVVRLEYLLMTAQQLSKHLLILHLLHRLSAARDISTHSMPRTMVCFVALVIRRLPLISASYQAASQLVFSWKS